VTSHRIRGGIIAGVAALALATLMFLPRFFTGGIAVGMLLLTVIVFGVLDLFGVLGISDRTTLDKTAEPVSLDDAPRWLRLLAGFNIRVLYLGLSLVAAGACRVSVIGTMDAMAPWSGPVLFGLGALTIVLARVFRKPFDGDLHQGFLVFGMATATIMATLGSHGLWDCWETHYGEVARRQLEQDDWISLFWEDAWFYSKPILIFWMMNLGMALFGVNVAPDSIPNHAEWGVRFLVAVLSIVVIWGVYHLLARRVSKRAGLFAAIVLTTTPVFGFMARQAITDMPFVGFMTFAIVLFLLGITAEGDATVKSFAVPIGRGKAVELSGFHGVIAGYLLVGVPQFLYLLTRSSFFIFGTRGHGDIKTIASKIQITRSHLSDLTSSLFGLKLGGVVNLSLDWALLGLLYLIGFGVILYTLRKERRVERLCYHGMIICLALSVMAKGLPGLILPILGLFGFWLVLAPWKMLLKPVTFLKWHLSELKRLDLPRGIPMFLLLASPWYVAMALRHGNAFFQRFFIHDHIKRLSAGVHGDDGTFQYFLEQFGYAAFPWVALFPAAMLIWPAIRAVNRSASVESPKERSQRLITIFFAALSLGSFMLFSMMVTKFHHYIFPMAIPAAVLIGLLLNEIWKNRVPRVGMIVLIALGIVIAVAKDMVIDPTTKAKGVLDGHTQIVGLFIYKYSRPYPEGDAYDFSTPLIVFSILFGALFLGWLSTKYRRALIALTLLAGLAFSHFLNQHYMIQLAPHWTQKHIIGEYYKHRHSPNERLIAYQMNWKGENFYTGNRVIPYVSTKNEKFKEWVEEHRGERHFFLTEQPRYSRMSQKAKPKNGPIEPLNNTCNKYKIGVADEL
jgi:4-amino-4-deoxy-L-arabinose transferase-like glycosyltransferase